MSQYTQHGDKRSRPTKINRQMLQSQHKLKLCAGTVPSSIFWKLLVAVSGGKMPGMKGPVYMVWKMKSIYVCMCIYIYRNIGQNNETTREYNPFAASNVWSCKSNRKKYLHSKAHKPYRNVSKLHYLKCSYFLTNCLTISITKKKKKIP